MASIFISYCKNDKNLADAVCHCLEQANISCWIAPRDVHAGKSYASEIVNAISACKIVILIVSGKINESQHVLNEVNLAVENDKIILPFKIDDVALNSDYQYYLGKTHWIDAFPNPTKFFAKLVKNVGELLEVQIRIAEDHDNLIDVNSDQNHEMNRNEPEEAKKESDKLKEQVENDRKNNGDQKIDKDKPNQRNFKRLAIILVPIILCLTAGVTWYSSGMNIAQSDAAKTNSNLSTETTAQNTASVQNTVTVNETTTPEVTVLSGRLNYGTSLPPISSFSVRTSSSLPDISSSNYGAANLVDQNDSTAWVEGADGDGIGEYAEYCYTGAQAVSMNGFIIKNGYVKSTKTFSENGSPSKLGVFINNSKKYEIDLQRTPEEQFISLEPVIIKQNDLIRFVIDEVEAGSKDRAHDSAISEITIV